MTGAPEAFTEPAPLTWSALPVNVREGLRRKLEGLYGGERDESVFDALAVDKQRALLVLARRLQELRLWDAVRRIENLYGTGGVGMMFRAWPCLEAALAGRRNFSTWFARHRNTSRGFIERGVRSASLHFLYSDAPGGRGWEAHFDLYNPWASPLNAWRHLKHEKIRRQTPDWRIICDALGYEMI